MFTVVVPTMWRYAPFLRFLEDLCKFELIDDIIIINNDIERTPKWSYADDGYWVRDEILRHPKITCLDQDENIFVNPAWNMGVAIAKNDMVCIMNDDLIFDLRVFYRVQEMLSEKNPLFGMIASDPVHNQPPVTDGAIDIVRWDGSISSFGFGQLMFVHKPSWLPIPADLLLYYGDHWEFTVHQHLGNTINLITNMMFRTPFAVTSSEVKSDKLETEHVLYNGHIEKFIHNLQEPKMSFIEQEYEKACNEPSDINEHIPTLKRLADECQTVIEFGVRTGVSTRAFLASNAAVWSVDLTILPEAIQLIDGANAEGKRAACSIGDSTQVNINPVDLLFIDTYHTFDQLTAELDRHHHRVNKYIVLHDTESHPELKRALYNFLARNSSTWYISEHFSNNNGLTVLSRTT